MAAGGDREGGRTFVSKARDPPRERRCYGALWMRGSGARAEGASCWGLSLPQPATEGAAGVGPSRGGAAGGGEGGAPADMREFGGARWKYGCAGVTEYRTGRSEDTAMPRCNGLEVVVLNDQAEGLGGQAGAGSGAPEARGGGDSGPPRQAGGRGLPDGAPEPRAGWGPSREDLAAFAEKLHRSSSKITDRMAKNLGWAASSVARAAETFRK